MNQVVICENIVDPSTWENVETENVCELLTKRFATWPSTARIYHKFVSQNCDVTPVDEATIDRLEKLTGRFFVVVYPAEPGTIFLIVSIIVAAIAIGLSFLLRPHTSANIKNQQQTSPNNELSSRQNKERPNERIPDIYGKLWSTPDLIAVPYRIFIANIEVEYAYYCIGRGNYTIDQVRDDLTAFAQITGSSAEIYGPNTSPNSGDAPQTTIGAAIGEIVRKIKPLSAINGQVLIAPNLAGGGLNVGPFTIGDADTTEVWVNFVAESGCYQIDNTTGIQTAATITLRLGVTPIDSSGAATGAEVTHDIVLTGDAVQKNRVGVTLKVTGLTSRVSIRAKRITNTNIAANISVSDEIKWRDAMAVAPIVVTNFGDVTTVQTVARPTPDALALKQRKLNLLVTRNIPIGTLSGGAVTFGLPGPTKNAADIFVAMCLDSRLGNRSLAEIDVVGIYTTAAAIAAYFGTTLCTQFCFTFDDSKVSFEESIADVATAIFCVAYRRGSVISISFEKQTVNSTTIFNHRNKLPASETRTVNFGTVGDIDGIEFTYNEPNDPNYPNVDTARTLYFPADQSAINPKRITAIGIRNNIQAFLLAARLYNKLLYQNTITQFNATQEASLCILQERILVADNTRPDTQDGEVTDANALILTLSQPVKFVGGRLYTIFLQHYDGTVESLAITAGPAPNQVVLAGAPLLPCVTDPTMFAKTTYIIVDNAPQRATAFLVSEKVPQGGMVYQIKAANYDDRYYGNDQDFALAHIVWNGNENDVEALPPIGAGATYHPTIVNDIGVHGSSGLSNTTGDVLGTFTTIIHLGEEESDDDPGDCIWSGFPHTRLTSDVHLYVTCSVTIGGASAEAVLLMNGSVAIDTVVSLGSTTYSVLVPAGTYLSDCTVEAQCMGFYHDGTAEIDITDIHIS